ncbi:MAG: hypothetical protein P4L59_09905 [Desulfosporosinus sp.]|nr:hypothetical protein [Desulfosporosinus sp.]
MEKEKSDGEITKRAPVSNVQIKIPAVGKVGDKIDPSKSLDESIRYFFS